MLSKTARWCLLALSCLMSMNMMAQEQDAVRFVDVTIRILTTGDRQPLREVGTFTSSLPLGRAGGLHRILSVSNETRHTSLSLAIKLTLTPTMDDAGLLHCVVLSDSMPQGGEAVSRAKDMTFEHPGEQLMELYADANTGTHVTIAVSAAVATQVPRSHSVDMPPILFLVRVEQWCGAQRAELENLQLQSLDGKSVSHDYSRRIPRWETVDSAEASKQPLDELPVLDLNNKETPVIKAGQGFTIPLTPEESSKNSSKKMDAQVPGEPEKKEESPKKIVWDTESYHLTLEPVSLSGDKLTLSVKVQGQILDPLTRKILPPVDLKAEKVLLSGQPVPFYLTREASGGPQGYVVWVVPTWSSAANPPETPTAGRPSGS